MPQKDRQSRTRRCATRATSQPAYARTTITIPGELKARMETVGSRVNWSAIASEAFKSRLSELEIMEQPMPELPDRDDALERLRRLKIEPESQRQGESSRAYVLGKRWAMADAHPDELQRLEEFFHSHEINRPLDQLKANSQDRRAVKELFRELTLSILGYKNRLRSIDEARLYPADIDQVRPKMKSFWEERIGVTLDLSQRHGQEFLSEFAQGALDFWQDARDQL
jgi:hypothetical protein